MNKKEKAITFITWSLMGIGVGLAIYGGIVKNPTLLWTGVGLAILSIIIGSIYAFAFREKKELYIQMECNNNTTLRNLLLKVKLNLLNEFVDQEEYIFLTEITENPKLAEEKINKLFENVKNSSGLGDSYYGTFLSKEFLDSYFEAIHNNFYLRLSSANSDEEKTDILNDLNKTINYISIRGLFGAIKNDGGILKNIANNIANNREETKERKDLANFILNELKVEVEEASNAIYLNKSCSIENKDSILKNIILKNIIGNFDPNKITHHCCADITEDDYIYKIQSISKIPFNIKTDSIIQESGVKNTK